MNETDITTVEELAEFMEAEAALTGRHDSEQLSVNGAGIRKQWHERINFPYLVYYMVGGEVEPHPDGTKRVNYEIKSIWFDIDGNKTDRPCGNDSPLYRNE